MAIKKKVDCTKCVNHDTTWCSECKHYKWLMDFYREAEYETTISQANEVKDDK